MTIYIEPEYVTRLEEENAQQKQRIKKLVSENITLQNDLFSVLIKDETQGYINNLKQELFNLYLKHYN